MDQELPISIPPLGVFRKWSNIVISNSVSVRFTRYPTNHPKRGRIAKRGSIRSFSRHSRLRLRESLSNAYLDSSSVFGITLTVPWRNLPSSPSEFVQLLDKYRECFHRFTINFRRRFPLSACIFRHELQVRRMPHCHLVAFMHSSEVSDALEFQRIVFLLWLKALCGQFNGGDPVAFARHGVRVDRLDNQVAMFRYVSDHASKSKQAQLGYIGKQWGYVNRSVLSNRVSVFHRFFSPRELIFFQREIYKCCRFRVKADCVFGSKLSRHVNGVSVLFVSSSTVNRIMRYIASVRVLDTSTAFPVSHFVPYPQTQ